MQDSWIHWLHQILGSDYSFTKIVAVGGGCINEARKAVGKSEIFIKRNDVDAADDMFRTEVLGLSLLRKNAESLLVPEVLYHGKDFQGYYMLILEWIEPGHESIHFWENFGRGLAQMHQIKEVHFGLDHDNYIGKLPQSNIRFDSWPDFYVYQRLLPQIKLGIESGIFDHEVFQQTEKLHDIISKEFPAERPALLHGDLWSGNYIPHHSGTAALIDPAVYYGNRETEIAFTLLFGGFDSHFYDAYNEFYPLQNGFMDRLQVHHLYPLLVHANLFGGGYVRRCKEILAQFR
jgi:fructosamine-3-kinase